MEGTAYLCVFGGEQQLGPKGRTWEWRKGREHKSDKGSTPSLVNHFWGLKAKFCKLNKFASKLNFGFDTGGGTGKRSFLVGRWLDR